MNIRQATRQGVRPIIDLYSESGGGKTYSALLLARGFVGPQGRIVIIDTESGRGELYADVPIFGGYDVLRLDDPFSPKRYIEAIEAVEKSGASIGIIDSGSHEWEGISGVLDMAAENESKSGKGLHVWKGPKMEHALFLQKLLRSTIPWIVCLRAKYKTRQIKEAGKKTEIVKDDYLTPIQADDFIFEATIHGEINLKHEFTPHKISHPDLARCVPNGAPITLEHGRLLAQWCEAPGKPTAAASTAGAGPDKKAMLADLRTLTEPIHKWKKGTSSQAEWEKAKETLEGWLVAKGIIGDGVALGDLSAERLVEVLSETKHALSGGNLL